MKQRFKHIQSFTNFNKKKSFTEGSENKFRARSHLCFYLTKTEVYQVHIHSLTNSINFQITNPQKIFTLFQFLLLLRMLKDFKFLCRNSGKAEEIENVPVNPKDLVPIQTGTDLSRPLLNAIQELVQNPKQESKVERTLTKVNKGRSFDHSLPLRTPDKHGVGVSMKQRFGWAQKHEGGSVHGDGPWCRWY